MLAIEISGDYLAILVTYFSNASPDTVFIYEWMTGKLKMVSIRTRILVVDRSIPYLDYYRSIQQLQQRSLLIR
jgi:hypothetical protein